MEATSQFNLQRECECDGNGGNGRMVPDAVTHGFDAPAPATSAPADDGMPPGRPESTWPASIRLVVWLIYLVRHVTVMGLIRAFSKLVRRGLVWVLMRYVKVYGLAKALRGGRVETLEYLEREGVCLRCPGLITRRSGGYFAIPDPPRYYCGPCGCGEWILARLMGGRWAKNRWRKHYCPEERHPSTVYPAFITISPTGCGQEAFKVPGGRADVNN